MDLVHFHRSLSRIEPRRHIVLQLQRSTRVRVLFIRLVHGVHARIRTSFIESLLIARFNCGDFFVDTSPERPHPSLQSEKSARIH